ncbi:hypothetical protein ADL19_31530 [Streptomyces purpurogeneiscleroticus]|nr:hypothetical protein ADL19_31530 [Streptomyces purpurogeneiscleroticus]
MEDHWPFLQDHRLARAAFAARWLHVLDLDRPSGIAHEAKFQISWAFRKHGVSLIDGLEP